MRFIHLIHMALLWVTLFVIPEIGPVKTSEIIGSRLFLGSICFSLAGLGGHPLGCPPQIQKNGGNTFYASR